jgi:TPR repeat protein
MTHAQAWQVLGVLMRGIGVDTPAQVLEEAVLKYRGEERATLLSAVLTAAGAAEVSAEDASSAALQLGEMYLRGDNVTRDLTRSIGYLQRGAELGSPEAQQELGVIYSSGFGQAQDPPLAATYLHFAAEGGSTWAQMAMGYRHLFGAAAPKQCEKALMYYSPVAEAVVATAQRLRGGGLLERTRLTVDNPDGGAKRGADDDVIQYYEHSAYKGSVRRRPLGRRPLGPGAARRADPLSTWV